MHIVEEGELIDYVNITPVISLIINLDDILNIDPGIALFLSQFQQKH